MEVWKSVVGFEGKYMVSNLGRILILNYKNQGKDVVASSKAAADGYHRVYLNCGYSKAFLVHRLVATHFLDLPEIEDRKQVNHIDGNKSNNCVENLEWVNAYENVAHAMRTGLVDNSGVNNGHAVLEESDIPVLKKMLGSGKITQRKLADIFGVTPMAISAAVKGVTWRNIK